MLRVNKELEALLPPLSEEEYAGLEASIIAHGCMSPVVIWGDIIVDGHHRYKICEKNQIPIKTKTLHFDSVDEAKLWAWQHQEHRRNMTPYQRTEIALQFKDTISAKAYKNRIASGGDRKSAEAKSDLENSPNPIQSIHTHTAKSPKLPEFPTTPLPVSNSCKTTPTTKPNKNYATMKRQSTGNTTGSKTT